MTNSGRLPVEYEHLNEFFDAKNVLVTGGFGWFLVISSG